MPKAPLSRAPATKPNRPGKPAGAPVITKVEVVHFEYAVKNIGVGKTGDQAFKPGAGEKQRRFAVRIETDQGVAGEYVPTLGRAKPIGAQVEWLAPLLIGRNALEREAINNDLRASTRHLDGTGVGPLDIALWDLAGKFYGCSVAELLGGWRTRLPVYVSTMAGDRLGGLDSPKAYADYAERCRKMGYRAYKMHIWHHASPEEVIDAMQAVRKRVGPAMALMIDLSGNMQTLADALKVGRACDEANFFWLEDPLAPGGFSMFAHRKLRGLIKTPLLLTEHIRTLETRTDFVVHEGTDFVRVDPDLDGGITGSLKAAHVAEGFGLDLELHVAGPARRQLMAAIRNANWYEGGISHPKALTSTPPVYLDGYSDELDAIGNDGCVPVPSGPGLGVRYDWPAIRRLETGRVQIA